MIRIVLSNFCLLLLLTNVCWGQFEASSPKIYSLDECIQLAEKHNVTLIAAKESYRVAKSDVWRAWGQLLPSLDSDLGYS
ncbi:MAG: hypothetical protein AMJ91_01740, partial [candidate division Zixibacteria bacterium SM23_73_3]